MSKRVANTKAKTARNGRGLNLKAKRRRAARRALARETALANAVKPVKPKPTLMQKVGKFLRPQKHS